MHRGGWRVPALRILKIRFAPASLNPVPETHAHCLLRFHRGNHAMNLRLFNARNNRWTALRSGAFLFGLVIASIASAKDAGRIDAQMLGTMMALQENARAVLELQLPGETKARSVMLERLQVYAPDARVRIAEADGLREIPRSDLLHFIARDGKLRLVLSLRPDGSGGDGMLL